MYERTRAVHAGRSWMLATMIGLTLGAVGTAGAATSSDIVTDYEFSIAPQPLSSALVQYAQQAQLQLFSSDAAAKLQLTRAVRGRYSAREALILLLQDSGLHYELSADSVLILREDPAIRRAALDPKRDPLGDLRLVQLDTGSQPSAAPVPAPAPVSGQVTAAAAGDARLVLEEIVVTANRRQERLLNVPLAVSAFTGQDIEDRGAISFKDLALSVPSLSLVESGVGRTRVQIRGIANRIGVPAVGYYLDEMAVTTEVDGQLLDVRTLDLERVEVLRGPQGTLYGQGSMGGTVKFITASPDLSAFSGKVELEGSTIDDGGSGYRGAVVANVPLMEDKLAVRVVAGHQKLPGWIDNTMTGERDINDGKIDTYRAKALWQVTDRFKASLMVMHQESRYDAEPQSNADRQIAQGLNSTGTDNASLYNLVLDWDLGPVRLLSSTGYMDRFQVQAMSIQQLAPEFGVDGFVLPSDWGIRMFEQEVRLSSAEGSPINWTAGVYYRDMDETIGGVAYSSPALPPELFASIGFAQNGGFTSQSWAVFGEANKEFASGLGVTLGLRYFEDKRGYFQDLGGLIESGENTFDTLNPRFSLSYRLSDDWRVYTSVSKGFRSGGFNNFVLLFPDIIPPTYDVEELWAYELGSKASLAGGRVALEGAVYYNDYSNIVDLRGFVDGTGRTRTYRANAGDASGYGVELSGSIRATERLTFSGQANWNDIRYQTQTAAHNVDDPVDSVPKSTYSASLDYRAPVAFAGANQAWFRIDYQFRDTIEWRRRDLNQNDRSDTFQSLDARIGLKWARWELSLGGTNLANKYGVVFADIGNLVEPIRPQPRTYSLLVRAEF